MPDGDSANYYKLGEDEKLVCRYKKKFDKDPCGEDGCVNKVKVKTKESSKVDGGKAKAEFEFNEKKVIGKKHLKVKDSNGKEWTFYKSGKRTYKKVFDCSEVDFKDGYGKYVHKNKVYAYNGKKKLYDYAKVKVRCYKLRAKKTAKATYATKYLWDIDKTADPTSMELTPDEEGKIEYDIKVDHTGYKHLGFKVKGHIYVHNPNPDRKARISAEITDKIAINGKYYEAEIECPDAQVDSRGILIDADSTLKCSYKAKLSKDKVDKDDCGKNIAKVKQKNHDFYYDHADKKIRGKFGNKTLYKAKKRFCFDKRRKTYNKCVKVTDTHRPDWKEIVCKDDAPETFSYTKMVSYTDEQCGDHVIKNTAYLKNKYKKVIDKAVAKVDVEVVCEGHGCTPGYWKQEHHFDDWTGYAPGDALTTMFDVPFSELDGDTLLEALEYEGGESTVGAARNLLRIAVAAVLTEAHSELNFPGYTEAELKTAVNTALASGNSEQIEQLKNELDALLNNNECPLPLDDNDV